MPAATIDGRRVEVPAGTTILAAARELGVDIPTLCHIEGLPPLPSCFLCVVEVVGQEKLTPACATLLEDAMVVVTDSPEVLAARKTAVELLLSDHLGECEAPCQISCPAGFHVPAFMDHVAHGEFGEAGELARDDLVLPAVLGLLCPRFCENTCRRRERDQAVAIAELHRYTAERGLAPEHAAGRRPPEAQPVSDKGPQSRDPAIGDPKHVAVVGAGPTGLSAAYNLLKAGHACTLIDQHPEPGGMLRYSLDEVRLPKAVLAGEVDVVRRMGARFRMGARLGRDVTLEQLRGEFDAVLLAVGAPLWRKLDCPGGELGTPAGEVLARVATGEAVDLEGDVIVVGAGQEAVEAARTAARRGTDTVAVVCPRPEAHLPLLARQIQLAKADGVTFHFGVEINEVRQPAVRFYLTAVQKQANVRFDCNHLLVAVGRQAELELLAGQGVETGRRGVAADRRTLATNLPGVFAAGEAVSGGGFCVRAIRYGQLAAASIDRFLRGEAAAPLSGLASLHIVRYGKLSDEEREMLQGRARNTGPRTNVLGDDSSASSEAARCLICGCQDADRCRLRRMATLLDADSSRFKGERRAMERDESHPLVVYESHKCIMCGACVAIVEAARDELGEGAGLTYVGRGFNVRVSAPWGAKLADSLGDLARRCAEACPTSAIVLKHLRDDPLAIAETSSLDGA